MMAVFMECTTAVMSFRLPSPITPSASPLISDTIPFPLFDLHYHIPETSSAFFSHGNPLQGPGSYGDLGVFARFSASSLLGFRRTRRISFLSRFVSSGLGG